MRFHSEDLEIYLKPHGDDSERFRLCEKPGIQIENTFKTACVFTKEKTDSSFDIVIRFGETFKLGSANMIQVDVRAGKGQTNHCFEDTAVFGIQTSWVHGQQHVISSFKAKAYDQTCCPDLEAQGAGKPMSLSATPENVGEGPRETDWAFLIRPMQDEQVWGKRLKGNSFDRDTTPSNITVYVTRGMVPWDSPDEVDHNPAEERVCPPKNMARFKALPGQEGDPYIAEFRPLDYSKKPIFWMETYANGELKTKHGSKRGLIVQPNAEFTEAGKLTHDRRQRMSSECETREAVDSQTMYEGGHIRRITPLSIGGGHLATQSTILQGDETEEAIALAPYMGRRSTTKSSIMQPDDQIESLQTESLPEVEFCDCPRDHNAMQYSNQETVRSKPRLPDRSEVSQPCSERPKADLLDRCKRCSTCGNPDVPWRDRKTYRRQMQKEHAPHVEGFSQVGTPSGAGVLGTPSKVQPPQETEARKSSAQPKLSLSARFANAAKSRNAGASLTALPQKRKRQLQSAEVSAPYNGGETTNTVNRPGQQGSGLPGTAVSDGRVGGTDENPPAQLARDSSTHLAETSLNQIADSPIQAAENTPVQLTEDEPFSRISGSSNVLNHRNRQSMRRNANELLVQLAAPAETGCSVSHGSSLAGFGRHPAETSNPREAAKSIQQRHLPLQHNFSKEVRTYTENLAQRDDTMLGQPASSSHMEQTTQGYPTGALQHRVYPIGDQHNDAPSAQYEQARNGISLDSGKARRVKQLAVSASSEGNRQSGTSLVPDQPTISNTPAALAEDARPSRGQPAQEEVNDLTLANDRDSHSSANDSLTNQTATDLDEEEQATDAEEQEIDEELAEIERANRILEIEAKQIDLQDRKLGIEVERIEMQGRTAVLLKRKTQLRAGQVAKLGRKGVVKLEQ